MLVSRPGSSFVYKQILMYLNLAILAFCILIYSIFAARIKNLPISGPILFVVFGMIAGPLFLDIFNFCLNGDNFKILAELALALVLFTDASKTNLRIIKKNVAIPARLLLIGLPLTILFGILAGLYIFDSYAWIELAILATILAPTDAALGKAVVSNPHVPVKIREALNVESGLNDGICVPVLYLLLALEAAQNVTDVTIQSGFELFSREIGIGLLVGIVVTYLADRLIVYCEKNKWINDSWKPMVIIALALMCFALAQALGGSGFIACFTGGLLFGAINKKNKISLLMAAEGTGETLSLVTWIIFGSVIIANYFPYFSWDVVFYTILSLTLVRMVPVFISLIKTRISLKEKLFIGWFGPRGLASIVFAIIILDIGLPNKEKIILTIVCTILISVLAHGFSANPLIKWLSKPVQSTKKSIL